MTISILLERKISITAVTLLAKVFLGLGIHFDDRPKILTYFQISSNSILLRNCPMKKKSVKHRVIGLFLKDTGEGQKRGK